MIPIELLIMASTHNSCPPGLFMVVIALFLQHSQTERTQSAH